MEQLAGFNAIDVLGQADYWVAIVGGIATVAFYTGVFAFARWLDGGGQGQDDNHGGDGSDFGGDRKVRREPPAAKRLPSRSQSPLKIDERTAAELVYDLGKYAKLNPSWTKQQRGFIASTLVDVVWYHLNHDATATDTRRILDDRMDALQAGDYRFKRKRQYEQAYLQVRGIAMWMSGQARTIRHKEKSTG